MLDENQAQTEVDGPESDSKTKLKRSRSSLGAKFKVVKKPKRDRKERKTLPSKLTEVFVLFCKYFRLLNNISIHDSSNCFACPKIDYMFLLRDIESLANCRLQTLTTI